MSMQRVHASPVTRCHYPDNWIWRSRFTVSCKGPSFCPAHDPNLGWMCTLCTPYFVFQSCSILTFCLVSTLSNTVDVGNSRLLRTIDTLFSFNLQ